MTSNIRKIFGHPLWFALGGLIFLTGGIRYFLREDTVGGIIYLIAAAFFFLGYLGQLKYNKRR